MSTYEMMHAWWQEGHSVHCNERMAGGAAARLMMKVSLVDLRAPITIRVKDQTGEETYFKLRGDTRMEKVLLIDCTISRLNYEHADGEGTINRLHYS
jgi:hypothetical protein